MFVFKAHAKPVTAIAFSPSGTLLATASGTERLVRVWEIGAAKAKKLNEWPLPWASSVAFTADSRIVAAGSTTAASAWDLGDGGKPLLAVEKGGGHVCISKQNVLFAHGNVATRRWSLPSGKPLPGEWGGEGEKDFNHGSGPAACTSDGTRLAAHFAPKEGPASRFLVRDAKSGAVVARLDRERVSVQPVRARFSYKDELFATSFGPDIVVWNVKTEKIVTTLSVGKKHVPDVAFTSRGACLVATSNDLTVRRWDTKTWKEKPVYEWDVGKLAALAVSDDECRIASAGATGKVIVWDVVE